MERYGSFRPTNPNPVRKIVGDCVIRGLAIILEKTWLEVYDELYLVGREMFDMMSSNEVWAEYLLRQGFERYAIPNTCPACYTIKEFCYDHPYGEYLLATGSHVVAVLDGEYYDTWDSGEEMPIYYFERR